MSWDPVFLPVGSEGNKVFNANWHEIRSDSPGFKTVALLDISGSMTSDDYKRSTVGIAANMMNFLNEESRYAKLQLYHGTYISNVTASPSDYIKEFDAIKI
jgi:hypothetical protein